MKKNVLVYLVPIVLVIGTAFGVGIVIGDTEDSQVTVDVEYVAPTIEITDHTEFPVEYQDDVMVEATVDAPGHENVVSHVEFEFEYIGEKGAGDAIVWESAEVEIDSGDWSEGEGVFEYTWDDLSTNDDMWRAGENDWEITATVYDENEDPEDDYTVDDLTVESYLEILGAEDGEAVGEPGEHLYGDDFEVPGNDEQPKIEIRSNDNWELEFGDFTMVHEDDEDVTIPGTGDYDEAFGKPEWSLETNINYDVEIPWGALHGTYTTEDDNATHTLTSICVPLDEYKAFTIEMSQSETNEYEWEEVDDMEETIEVDFEENEPTNQYHQYVRIVNPEGVSDVAISSYVTSDELGDDMGFRLEQGIVEPSGEELDVQNWGEGFALDIVENGEEAVFTMIYTADTAEPGEGEFELSWEFKDVDPENGEVPPNTDVGGSHDRPIASESLDTYSALAVMDFDEFPVTITIELEDDIDCDATLKVVSSEGYSGNNPLMSDSYSPGGYTEYNGGFENGEITIEYDPYGDQLENMGLIIECDNGISEEDIDTVTIDTDDFEYKI